MKDDNNITRREHYKIARELERHHAIFERVWSMGRIRFSKKVPTAAVLFNKKGNCVEFIVNREFWLGLDFTTRCFVIAHECMHVALNHGVRSAELRLNKMKGILANWAQDIVINHGLVNRYGFDRDHIDPLMPFELPAEWDEKPEVIYKRKYCWVETYFEADKEKAEKEDKIHATVTDDKNFEYYYTYLLKEVEKRKEAFDKMKGKGETVDDHDFSQGDPQKGEGEGEGKEGEGGGNGLDSFNNESKSGKGKGEGGDVGDLDPDDFDYFDNEDYTTDFGDVVDKLNKEMPKDEKDTLENFLEGNKGSSAEPGEKNPDYGPTGVSDGRPDADGNKDEASPHQAGTTAGTGWTFAKKTNPPKKRKFESIITSWAKKRLVPEYQEIDQWTHTNRRFSLVGPELLLPSEYETLDEIRVEDKIEVWFYQDTSGSCSGYTDRFFAIADAMPLEKFNMRMFCFDTQVYETNLIDRKLFGFGGTYFHVLENHIQEEIENSPKGRGKIKYPDAIFVVTDGYGSDIVPAKPKNWHWILTPGASKENIPEECNFHDLEKYE